jgi:ABC-type phosphate transport system ATPase subunit
MVFQNPNPFSHERVDNEAYGPAPTSLKIGEADDIVERSLKVQLFGTR